LHAGDTSGGVPPLSPLDFKAFHARRAAANLAATVVRTIAVAGVVSTSLESIETNVGQSFDLFGNVIKVKVPPPPRPPKDAPGDVAWWEKTRHRFAGVEHEFTPADEIETNHRHDFWHFRRVQVRKAYDRLNFSSIKKNHFDNCGSACFVQRSPSTDRLRLSANHCHHRFCLACGQTRSRLIARNLVKHIDGRATRFITLTLKHRDEPLKDQVTRAMRCFRNLRSCKLWKESVTGGACFIEIKRSKNGKFWHPHLHILAEGSFIEQRKLSAQWLLVTGDSNIVDIRFVREAGYIANYVAKYASKPLDLSIFGEADWLDEAIMSLHGRRLCTTFGKWRGVELEEKPEDPKDWETICSFVDLCLAKDRLEPWALALHRNVTGHRETAHTNLAQRPTQRPLPNGDSS
jgi:hypothetical protein